MQPTAQPRTLYFYTSYYYTLSTILLGYLYTQNPNTPASGPKPNSGQRLSAFGPVVFVVGGNPPGGR